ncbi:two-component system regulatory protein YycI [Salibacterium halotolerans]|uniref:Two-component signal transduction system YycFG, regulatory protein YycI n=1 Tax=Salibacterium halotolerans TaxID=1884432 RepID=A0A1I5U2R7_9BACI|nr:two-component system regulatory protein YycI [Salibacterium halotolerans]SFP89612.1 Two-component signal transduction system YycFG, regulatory protein YycI [Salibacterium halotolerans]
MDWSRTKTIFILAFLLLNTFLLQQMVEQQSQSELNVRAQNSTEEELNAKNITVTDDLPAERDEISHIVGESIDIEEEVSRQAGEENVSTLDSNFVEVTLQNTYAVSGEADIQNFLDQQVWNGSEYAIEEINEEEGQVLLNQVYEDKTTVTYDENPLVLFLNDDNEIESYIQSYMEFEEGGEQKDMLSTYGAIDRLLTENILSNNDEVNEVELRYYSLFAPEGSNQVMAPMYRMEVNGESEYLVNAIGGTVRTLQEVSDDSGPVENPSGNTNQNEGSGGENNGENEENSGNQEQ